MDARDIKKWERIQEIASDCCVKIKLSDKFMLYNKKGHTLGAFLDSEEVFAFLCGYAHAFNKGNGNE